VQPSTQKSVSFWPVPDRCWQPQGVRGPHRKTGEGACLSSSPTVSSEQKHKRHKSQNATRSTAMSIYMAGVSEYIGGDYRYVSWPLLLAPAPTHSSKSRKVSGLTPTEVFALATFPKAPLIGVGDGNYNFTKIAFFYCIAFFLLFCITL
jgi:hypothetical protein